MGLKYPGHFSQGFHDILECRLFLFVPKTKTSKLKKKPQKLDDSNNCRQEVRSQKSQTVEMDATNILY